MQSPAIRRMLLSIWATAVLLLGVVGMTSPLHAAWSTLETEHFFIHYTEPYEEVAQRIAGQAESVHRRVVERLQHQPVGKTHVVLREAESTNAYATTYPYPHIVMQLAFPSQSQNYLAGFGYQYMDALELIFLHEYTHIVHTEMRPPTADAVMRVLGRVPYITSPLFLTPPFFLEGFAVYEESQLPGGRGDGTFYRMFLRAAVRDGALPELDQVLGAYRRSGWQPAGDYYLYGSSFVAWLSKQFGEQALATLHEHLVTRPDALGQAVEAVTALPLDQVWWRWQRDTSTHFGSELRRLQSEPISPVHEIDTVGQLAIVPELSPDRSRIAFLAGGDVAGALRVYDRTTGREQHLANLQGLLTGSLAWHPAGEHIVIGRQGDAPTYPTHLAEIDLRTGRVRDLPGTERAFAPTYAPDGERLAFIRRKGWETELHLLHRTDGTTMRLPHPDGLQLIDLAWSPTSDMLAIAYWREGHGGGIALYDIRTGAWHDGLVAEGYTYGAPSWSPDGQYLLFHGDPTGVFNLYRYDLATGKSERMTNTETGLFHARWLSEDRWVAMEYTAEGYRLVEVDVTPYATAGLVAHTERVAVEDDVAGASVDGTLSARPYSPLQTLRPTFWLPTMSEVNGEPYVGAVTLGRDVLGEISYGVELRWGYQTGDIAYLVELERAFGSSGYALHTRLENGRVRPGPSGWVDRTQATFGVSRLGGTATTSHRVMAQIARVHDRPLYTSGVEATGHFVSAGWSYVGQGGRYGLRSQRQAQALAQVRVEDLRDWRFTYQQVDRVSSAASGWAMELQTALGWSGKDDAFSLGGETGLFALRGFGYNEARGGFAVRLAGEGRLPVWTWERGIGDRPIFFRDLSLHPFGEVGYVAAKQPGGSASTLVSVGAELGLRLNLGYSLSEADWRVGAAYGVGEPGLRLYVRVGTSF